MGIYTPPASSSSGATPLYDYKVGDWYPSKKGGSNTSGALLDQIAVYYSQVIEQDCPIDRIAFEVITAAGSTDQRLRVGVFADDGFCKPGARLAQLANVNPINSPGVKEVTGLSFTLPKGQIWWGVMMSGAGGTNPTFRGSNGGTAGKSWEMFSADSTTPTTLDLPVSGYQAQNGSGDLLNPAPTMPTLALRSTGAIMPLIMFRAA